MKKFYNVHPTTTAGRDLMRAENFLAADLSIEKNADIPQILIYIPTPRRPTPTTRKIRRRT